MTVAVDIWLIIGFFIIAVVYGSVGFGGGSSYKALLALYGFESMIVRSVGLVCNLAVVVSGVWLFFRHGHLRWQRVWPLLVGGTPAAFLGGAIYLSEAVYFVLLGFTLVLAAAFMGYRRSGAGIKLSDRDRVTKPIVRVLIGAGIGFLSGLVGIGGGIFLAPVLHFFQSDPPKEIAAACSAYILVNSIAGLAGQFTQTAFSLEIKLIIPLIIVVGIGGWIGARFGAQRLSPLVVRRWTAVLIGVVGMRILWEYLPLWWSSW